MYDVQAVEAVQNVKRAQSFDSGFAVPSSDGLNDLPDWNNLNV
jgi:hypothetical protein